MITVVAVDPFQIPFASCLWLFPIFPVPVCLYVNNECLCLPCVMWCGNVWNWVTGETRKQLLHRWDSTGCPRGLCFHLLWPWPVTWRELSANDFWYVYPSYSAHTTNLLWSMNHTIQTSQTIIQLQSVDMPCTDHLPCMSCLLICPASLTTSSPLDKCCCSSHILYIKLKSCKTGTVIWPVKSNKNETEYFTFRIATTLYVSTDSRGIYMHK